MSLSDDAVDAKSIALFGTPLGPAAGVTHVVSTFRETDADPFRVLRVGPAPRSATDFFVLSLTRARVDAIVIGGGILRAEPHLRYDLSPDLSAWRGRPPPLLLVLTRGRDLPLDHPVWSSEAQPVVWTSEDAAGRLRGRLPSRVEVVGAEVVSPRRALRYLAEERGVGSVSVEAGPRVAAGLYESPCVIDELLLSVYDGTVVEAARGDAVFDGQALADHMYRVGGPTLVEEPSGRWSFSRWIRRSGGPAAAAGDEGVGGGESAP